MTLSCDGQEIGTDRVEKKVPALFYFDDFLDIGQDTGQPVVDDYAKRGGVFTGAIESVLIDVSPDSHHDVDLTLRAKASRQ